MVLKMKRTSRSKMIQLLWSSRKLLSRQGKGRAYLVLWTLVTFQVVKAPRSKSLTRLLFPRFQNLLHRWQTWITWQRTWYPSRPFHLSSLKTFLLLQPKLLIGLRTHPSEPAKRSPNLVLDEGYAQRSFKGLVTDNKVNACYNMLVKDFERFAIHDLFKVNSFHFLQFPF